MKTFVWMMALGKLMAAVTALGFLQDRNMAISSSSTATTMSTSTRRPPDNCGVGGECDCSDIEDKNGEEYFQCVTNPNCEHCWITTLTERPRTSSATATTTASESAASSSTDYMTMPPGTYTETSSGTVVIIIVKTGAVPTTTGFAALTTTEGLTSGLARTTSFAAVESGRF
ncbi:hypothetical protein B0I35DRAFT_435688 [Stachybotrys elegans]|uniref:CBM1 domain-containing protein n=1 Tax=Stachybotrys elegans TaxID=80388 RepID=A0A8K0WQG2_9HYPO|nr:hypothetical protein B0I35DRAFT_435688 [Stachybotrys elegans]